MGKGQRGFVGGSRFKSQWVKNFTYQKKMCLEGPWQNPGPQTSVHDIIQLQSRNDQTCRKSPRFPSEESTDRLKFFPSHFLQTRNIHAKLSNKNIRVNYRGPGRNSTKKCGCRLLKQEMSLLYLIFFLSTLK